MSQVYDLENINNEWDNELNRVIPLNSPIYVQLFDRNFNNHLQKEGQFLNLSNEGINPSYVNGDFYLVTNDVKNDTLVIPDNGLYKITVALDTSFVRGQETTFGDMYTITYNVVDSNNVILTQLYFSGMMPNEEDVTMTSIMTRTFMYEAKDDFSLRILLYNFDLSNSLMNQIQAYNVVLIVEKMPESPKN